MRGRDAGQQALGGKKARCGPDLEDPADDVENAAVGDPHLNDLGVGQAAFRTMVEAKDAVKLVLLEGALGRVRVRVAAADESVLAVAFCWQARAAADGPAVLSPGDPLNVDRKERVGHPRPLRRIADVQDVECHGRHEGDQIIEAQGAKAGVGVGRVADGRGPEGVRAELSASCSQRGREGRTHITPRFFRSKYETCCWRALGLSVLRPVG